MREGHANERKERSAMDQPTAEEALKRLEPPLGQ
jgi:hypothetical protein